MYFEKRLDTEYVNKYIVDNFQNDDKLYIWIKKKKRFRVV